MSRLAVRALAAIASLGIAFGTTTIAFADDPASDPSVAAETTADATNAPEVLASPEAAPPDAPPAPETALSPGEPESPAAASVALAPTADSSLPDESNVYVALAAACSTGQIDSGLVDVSVSDTTVGPWQAIDVIFHGSLPDGAYCAGSTLTIGLPSQLHSQYGTYEIKDENGVVMGTMTVTPDAATLTFNSYIETHRAVTFNGHIHTQINDSFEPGEPFDLNFEVNGEAHTVPVAGNPCDVDCQTPGEEAWKWAGFEAGNPDADPPSPDQVNFGIISARTTVANEVITFVDNLGSGQAMQCDSLRVTSGTTANSWGDVNYTTTIPSSEYTLTCTTSGFTLVYTAPVAGTWVRVNGYAFTTVVQETYSNEGTVSQNGVTAPVHDTAENHTAEVGGSGEVPSIDIEKWSSEGAPTYDADGNVTNAGALGDFDAADGVFKQLTVGTPETITFTVSNNGTEDLRDIEVSDALTSGVGAITGLTCTFPDDSTGTHWAGPFAVATQFTCTGTLPELGGSQQHVDTANVVGVGVISGVTVGDEDTWQGETPPVPAVDIEKWSTVDGYPAGDFDNAPGKTLDPAATTAITLTITNTGSEPLVNVAVSDALTSGTGALTGLTCTFPGGSTGTTWAGPFAIGAVFTCTGTLPALGNGATHANSATVTATGQITGKPVTDTDTWNGLTPPVVVPPTTPPATPPTPAQPTLPRTGADIWPLALLALVLVGTGSGLVLARRRHG